MRRWFPPAAISSLLFAIAAAGLAPRGVAQTTAPTAVHVASIDVTFDYERHGFAFRGNNFQSFRVYGVARVAVVDDLGQPVEGAVVTARFSGDHFRREAIVIGVTGPNGSVTLWCDDWFAHTLDSPFFIQCCVTDIEAALPYDPMANVTTCGTLFYSPP